MKRQQLAMAYADEAYDGFESHVIGQAYPSAKAARLSSGPDAEDAWSCGKCGNFNYGGRAVCNMRSCGATKTLEAWTCPGCGNENHPNRPFCNMRSCGMAKPGLRQQDILLAAQQAKIGGLPGPQVVMPNVLPQTLPPASHGAYGGQPGSWACTACGNVNWPARTVCNGKNGACGQPRPAGAGAAPRTQMPAAHRLPAAQKPRGAPPDGAANPPGSWQCAACGNMNWPTRTTCNGKKGGAVCGLTRSDVCPSVVAPAAAPVQKRGGDAGTSPEGSWVCHLCQNVNYPQRTTCNRRSCGAPRAFG